MSKKYKNPRKMFHTLKPLQRRRDIHGYIPIVMYSNTLPCTHAGSCYTVTDIILVRSDRRIIMSSRFIRFVNKEYEIQIIRAVHHHAPSSMVIQMDGAT